MHSVSRYTLSNITASTNDLQLVPVQPTEQNILNSGISRISADNVQIDLTNIR